MRASIGLSATTECISKHPYIITEGEHVSFVAGNILVEQMNFYSLRINLGNMLADMQDNKTLSEDSMKYWSTYQMLHGQKSVFEEAIQRGMCFNYDAILEDIQKCVVDGDFEFSQEFINNFESLAQICAVKVIESKLLAMFDKEISREFDAGGVSLLQGITSATDFIYSMYITAFPTLTDVMANINTVDFFKEYEKGLILTKEYDLTREEALSKYLNIPTELIDQMMDVAGECQLPDDFIQQFSDNFADFVCQLSEMNDQHANYIKESKQSEVSNESMNYVPNDKKPEDDYSIL